MRSTLFVYPQDHLSIVVLTNLQGSNPEWFMDEIAGYYIPGMKAKNGFGLSPYMKMLYLQTISDGYQNLGSVYQKIKKKIKTSKCLKMRSIHGVIRWWAVTLKMKHLLFSN
ncbi:hypothetical protein [Chryseobacterium sp. NFX27]|uniref:hypothetical protein n=1 Tax=Chryseobacterium sp. NFX27 TaxID=2819618 RepID=UPI003CEA538C